MHGSFVGVRLTRCCAGKASKKTETPAGTIDLATVLEVSTENGILSLQIESKTCVCIHIPLLAAVALCISG